MDIHSLEVLTDSDLESELVLATKNIELEVLKSSLKNSVKHGSRNDIEEVCDKILAIQPDWIPEHNTPGPEHWYENAQIISYEELPGHIDPRNIAWYYTTYKVRILHRLTG